MTQQGAYPFDFVEVPATPVLALGAASGVPGSLAVVEGDGRIPYTPEARAIKDENAANWIDRDPELKCYLPGIPRAMYMPYPFQISPDAIHYEVTITDPNTFTEPWRISMPLYRRLEENMQLLEYRCIEFVEEFLYGHVRKEQLVTTWEGETIIVDIRRKVPPGDAFYDWYRK